MRQVKPCTPSGSFPLQSSLFLFVCCAAVVHCRVWSFLGMDSSVPQTQCMATLQPLTCCAPPPVVLFCVVRQCAVNAQGVLPPSISGIASFPWAKRTACMKRAPAQKGCT